MCYHLVSMFYVMSLLEIFEFEQASDRSTLGTYL